MKRSFLVIAVLMAGICSLQADEPTRALQAKLKEGGFYFGELNGSYTSETAAAVTRYQIRNGLQISGKLDEQTAKSLGLAAPAANTPAQPTEAETWRRLRKSDQQFLERLNTQERSTKPKVVAPPPNETKTSGEYAQTFVLSRERLRDYVAAFVLAGLDPDVNAELEFFADRVNYFDDGPVDRDRIRRDLQSYDQHWPVRRFWLDGQVEVQPRPDSRLRVTFPLRYDLRNGSKHSTGRVHKTLVVEVTGEDLQIVAVNERR